MNPHMHRRLAPASRDGRIGGSLYFFDQFMIVIALWVPYHAEIRVIEERPVSMAAPLQEPRVMVVKVHASMKPRQARAKPFVRLSDGDELSEVAGGQGRSDSARRGHDSARGPDAQACRRRPSMPQS